MTRVPELMAAGVTVAFGHDCVMDPWYPLGSGDMLEVASMGLHVAQMTGADAMRACFDAVTVNAARILGLDGYGSRPAAAPTSCCCRRAIRSRRSVRLAAQTSGSKVVPSAGRR